MALLVDLRVERGWPAAVAAFVLTVANLVSGLRNGGRDATSAQESTVRAGGVGLVGEDPVGPGAWPSTADPGYADSVQDGFELRAVASLPGGDQQGEWLLPLLGSEMGLGGEPTSGSAQRVILRLDIDSTG